MSRSTETKSTGSEIGSLDYNEYSGLYNPGAPVTTGSTRVARRVDYSTPGRISDNRILSRPLYSIASVIDTTEKPVIKEPEPEIVQPPEPGDIVATGRVHGVGLVRDYKTFVKPKNHVDAVGSIRAMARVAPLTSSKGFVDTLFDGLYNNNGDGDTGDTGDTEGDTESKQGETPTSEFYDWVISTEAEVDTGSTDAEGELTTDTTYLDTIRKRYNDESQGVMNGIDIREYDRANDLVFALERERRVHGNINKVQDLQEQYINYNKDLYTPPDHKVYPGIITVSDLSNYMHQPITSGEFNANGAIDSTLLIKVKQIATTIVNLFHDLYQLCLGTYTTGDTNDIGVVRKFQTIVLQRDRMFALGCLLCIISLFVFLRHGK